MNTQVWVNNNVYNYKNNSSSSYNAVYNLKIYIWIYIINEMSPKYALRRVKGDNGNSFEFV